MVFIQFFKLSHREAAERTRTVYLRYCRVKGKKTFFCLPPLLLTAAVSLSLSIYINPSLTHTNISLSLLAIYLGHCLIKRQTRMYVFFNSLFYLSLSVSFFISFYLIFLYFLSQLVASMDTLYIALCLSPLFPFRSRWNIMCKSNFLSDLCKLLHLSFIHNRRRQAHEPGSRSCYLSFCLLIYNLFFL